MPIPGAGEELAEIHEAFAETVSYTGAGLSNAAITAIPSDSEAQPFQGSDGSIRTKSYELQQADLSGEPNRGDVLVLANNTSWRVIEAQRRDDVAAYVVIVEAIA